MYRQTTLFHISLAAAMISIFMYLACVLGRIGMGDELNILPLLLSISIILLPAALEGVFKLPLAFLQFVVLIFFFALGCISSSLEINLSLVLYATAIITLFRFFRNLRISLTKQTIIGGLLVIFLALKLISILWMTNGYLSPLAPEAYAIGHLHMDTIYLTGLTSIIKTYQVTTTGLFGLVPIQYHAGSNYLFASFSQLCDLSTVKFYNFAFPVIFVPLFFQTLFFATLPNLKRKSDAFRMIISLLILFFVVSGFVPNSVGYRYLTLSAFNNHFLSESYCISLILMFLFISLYKPFLKTNQVSSHPVVNALLILMIPVWFFAIGYAKISTAIILFVAFFYLIVRRKLIFQKWILISTVLTIVLLPLLLFLTIESNRNATFSFDIGSFYKYYVKDSLVIYFLLNYYFVFFMVLCFIFYIRRSDQGIFKQIIEGKYIVPETIIVAAIAGIMPGLLIEIEGGSAAYFSDVQNWLSIMAIISVAPYLIYKLYKHRGRSRTAFRILYLVLLIVIVREAVFRSFYYFLKQNIRVREALMYGKDWSDLSRAGRNTARPTFIGKTSASAIMDRLKACLTPKESTHFNEQVQKLKLSVLEDLRKLPLDVKRRSVIYCEDPEELPKFKDCAEAFYLTSFTEIALINGLYWKDCFSSGGYSFRYYATSPTEINKQEAFQLAREKGFSNVIVLNLKGNTFSLVNI
ncbi:MAG: hypothetical protein WD824_01000 [Cyclobacteriaceae bacterium]